MPTTHTTPIDLRGFHGRECEAVLNNEAEIHCKGKISVNDNGQIFVCQDVINCTQADDKLGFKYSWQVQRSDQDVFWKENLISITILDPPSSIDPRWDWKDGEIVENGDNKFEVCFIHDKIITMRNIKTNACRLPRTLEEAYRSGYRKLPTRKLTEITEEMFRSTAWYGKKVMYNGVEQGIYAVHYDVNSFTLIQNGEQDYSQCKLIEE